jgi:endogenous inhibitor of DNA gyrase (YacG/DUF329 family)
LDKINYGPCKICGGPILYLGSNFCSPRCNSVALQPGSVTDTKIQVSRPNFAPTPVSLSEPEPKLVPESVVIPEPVLVPEPELVQESEPELTITLEPIAVEPEEIPEEIPEFMVVAESPKPPKKPKKPKKISSESVSSPKLEEPVRKKLYL